MSLYLRYRSQTFSDVVEQDHIVTLLKAHVTTPPSKVNYIFFGPRGTGKTSCARILARGLNCLNPTDGSPCGKCANCQQTDPEHGQCFDIIEIDAASNTGVDNIRDEIIEKSRYAPTGGLLKKVYIIDEVHMLSKGAFNALLKIMEAPPLYLTFILATTEIHKVPETILSRCQIFRFHHISHAGIVTRLKFIAEKEGIHVDDDAYDVIAKISGGCMRDAIKYLEQVHGYANTVSIQAVQKILGVPSNQAIRQLCELSLGQNQVDAVKHCYNLINAGIPLATILDEILILCLDEQSPFTSEEQKKLTQLVVYVRQNQRIFPHPHFAWKAGLNNLSC